MQNRRKFLKKHIMKKTISAFVLIMSVSLLCGINSFAQKKFKGIVTFTISYSGTIDPATAAQQPKGMTVSIYENMQKMNLLVGPYNIDIISNGDNKTSTTLLDAMGNKIYFKESTEEIETQISEKGEPVITYKDETKTVAGYLCKKAEFVENKDGEVTTTIVFYTEELGGEALNYGGQFNKLKGFALEYVTTTADGIISNCTATEVKKGKVKDTDFLIPDDYVECPPDVKQQIIDMFKGGE